VRFVNSPPPNHELQNFKSRRVALTFAHACHRREGQGEPDFDTPQHIKDAAAKALAAGFTKYTPSSGIPELREAIAAKFQRENGLAYKPSQVIVSCGGKHSCYNVILATCEAGDEVIIPAPYWLSYPEMVKLAGAKPVILQTSDKTEFKVTPAQLRAAITPNTRLFVLNSPSNPTGSVYTPEELAALADVAIERNLYVVSDEIYEHLIYGQHQFVSFPTVRPGLLERTIVVNGVSKSYAMTGWRIGWTLSPANIAKAMGDLQSQQTSNPCSISQYAAMAALEGPQQCVSEMRTEFAKRRDFVRNRLAKIPGLSVPEMGGAFYAFVNIKPHLGKTYGGIKCDNSAQWCLALLEQQNVGTVMGSAFGAEGYIRISYAASMSDLAAGLDHVAAFIAGAK
jgi:aspartate aminotransferase